MEKRKMVEIFFLFVLFFLLSFTSAHHLSRTVFVVMTQQTTHHNKIANVTLNNLQSDLIHRGLANPMIVDLQRDYPVLGGWTYFPLVPKLVDGYGDRSDWFLFLDETSVVDVENLEKMISKYGDELTNEDQFIGHVITDPDKSALHGYAKGGFMYPDLAAGKGHSKINSCT